MDFQTFFVKKIMVSFFIATTLICSAMALIGMLFEPNVTFGYEAFLSPLIFGGIASLPQLVMYSKEELTLLQITKRKVLQLIMIEILILTLLNYFGILTSISLTASLGISIFLIYSIVNGLLLVVDRKSAYEFNNALKNLQNSNNGEHAV